jgi:hypothetical protein
VLYWWYWVGSCKGRFNVAGGSGGLPVHSIEMCLLLLNEGHALRIEAREVTEDTVDEIRVGLSIVTKGWR